MAQTEQNFRNHARTDPMFHGFLFVGSLILLGAAGYAAVRQPGWQSALHVFGVVWLIVLMFKVRLYSLKVQDRVIRLEERLRLAGLLPESGRPRIAALSEGQLVALRFASDGEVAALAIQALEGNWDQKQIKQKIQTWRPDYWRV